MPSQAGSALEMSGFETVDVQSILERTVSGFNNNEVKNLDLDDVLFLVDWKHCLETGVQAGPFSWVRDVDGVFDEGTRRKGLETGLTNCDESLRLKHLPASVLSAIQQISDIVKRMSKQDIQKVVNSTYAVRASNMGESIPIADLARAYRQKKTRP